VLPEWRLCRTSRCWQAGDADLIHSTPTS